MRIALLLSSALLAALAATPAAQAGGAGTISGAATLDVTCNLPAFPGAGTTTCNGTATGEIHGVDNKNAAYAIACAPSCTVTTVGTITYSEAGGCLVPVGPPVTGTADGTLRITGGTVVNAKGDTSAVLDVPFHWQRVGADAIITDGKLSGNGNKVVTLSPSGNFANDVVGSTAHATLIPTNPAPPNDCSTVPGGAQQVRVVAEDVELA